MKPDISFVLKSGHFHLLMTPGSILRKGRQEISSKFFFPWVVLKTACRRGLRLSDAFWVSHPSANNVFSLKTSFTDCLDRWFTLPGERSELGSVKGWRGRRWKFMSSACVLWLRRLGRRSR